MLLTFTASAFACSCLSTEEIIEESVAKKLGLHHYDITVHKLVETNHSIYSVGNRISMALTDDADMKCHYSCSTKGLRLAARVSYNQNGKTCAAKVIKRARNEHKVTLENVICH